LPSREKRALLLGSPGCGKTALLNALGCAKDPLSTIHTPSPETSSTFVKLNRKNAKSKGDDKDETVVVHLIITEVPEAEAENQLRRRKILSRMLREDGCDFVILAFDLTNSASFAYVKQLEKTLLTDDMPRVYVGTKSDQCPPMAEEEKEGSSKQAASVLEEATSHCQQFDLEPPLVTSAGPSMLSADGTRGEENRTNSLTHLARCCLVDSGVDRLRAKPHEERKRQEAAKRRNRKMLWFGVSVGVAVAVVGYLISNATGSGKGATDARDGRSRLGWLRSLFVRDLSPTDPTE